MTNDEKELMKDLINQASDKVKLLQKTVIEKDIEIEQLKAEVKQAQIDVLNKAKERCDLVAEELEDEIDHYGSSAAYNCAYEIKKLIEEIKNDK